LPRQTSPAKHLLHARQRASSTLNINVRAVPSAINPFLPGGGIN
jgi:hypothetical protein